MIPMKKPNPLSLVSFICGLVALISSILNFLLHNFIQVTDSILFITDGILIPMRNISGLGAIITGILALRNIKNKGHAEKGKWLAWTGIALGAAWLLFGIIVGLVFLISIIAQVW